MVKLYVLLVWVGVAVAGCGTRTTLAVHDAGIPRDGAGLSDARIPDDVFVAPDAPAIADAFPDVFVPPEAAPDGPAVQADAVTDPIYLPPEAAPDGVFRDGPSEASQRDSSTVDLAVFSDASSRDFGSEPASPETGSPDVATTVDLAGAPEVSREVPPFVVDGALASYCSGDLAHMIVNGIESYPVVTGTMIPLDCCDAGLFSVTTQSFAEPITFRWQRYSGIFQYPASVDLANPGSGWSLRLVAGCDPVLSSCTGSGDAYTTGLEGLLGIARSGSQLDMSLCLHVEESAASPHPIIHTLDLYAPHVPTRW
jgi:hypothetical protein